MGNFFLFTIFPLIEITNISQLGFKKNIYIFNNKSATSILLQNCKIYSNIHIGDVHVSNYEEKV